MSKNKHRHAGALYNQYQVHETGWGAERRGQTSVEVVPAGQGSQLQFTTEFHVALKPAAVFDESELNCTNILPVFASYTVVLPLSPLREATVAACRLLQVASEHSYTLKRSNPASVETAPKPA